MHPAVNITQTVIIRGSMFISIFNFKLDWQNSFLFLKSFLEL